jgi:hypothetical protein
VRKNPEKLKRIKYDDNEYSYIKFNLSDIPDEKLFYYQRKANKDFYINPSRIVRIARDFPQKQRLPLYIPEFLKRPFKGVFS